MTRSLLIALLLAIGLTACGKKEEAAAVQHLWIEKDKVQCSESLATSALWMGRYPCSEGTERRKEGKENLDCCFSGSIIYCIYK